MGEGEDRGRREGEKANSGFSISSKVMAGHVCFQLQICLTTPDKNWPTCTYSSRTFSCENLACNGQDDVDKS